MSKLKKVKINGSFPRMVSTKCKNCLTGPTYYYRNWSAEYFRDVNSHKKFMPKKFRKDFYLYFDPIHYDTIYDFSFQTYYKSYSPRKHYIRNHESRIRQFFTCSCSQTMWGFKYDYVKNRPEIINRRAPINYPTKFEAY